VRTRLLPTLFAVVSVVFCYGWLVNTNALAQSTLSKIEPYATYSMLRPNLPSGATSRWVDAPIEPVGQFVLGNVLGWNGGTTFNFTRSFGITADFSGYYRSFKADVDGESITAHLNLHTFLFGPTFTKKGERLTPYARTLVGVGRGHADATVDSKLEGTATGFVGSVGGGLNVAVNPHIALRAIQFDFFPARYAPDKLWFNSVRWGTGVVFYLSH
jgi:outer membrane protein with beta-barrel domain